MRALAALSLVLLAGCAKETPGLLVHVTMQGSAVTAAEELVITVANPSGSSLGTLPADTTESGVVVHTDAGKVQLRLGRGSFPIAREFDLLVVASGPSLTVRLEGAMYATGGALIGGAAAVQGDLTVDRRTSVDMTFACTAADCHPVANPGPILDLASSTIEMMTVTGTADGDRLIPLAVGNFTAAGGDLVASSQAKGTVYIFYGRDWSVPGHPSTIDAGNGFDVKIIGRSGETLGDTAAVGDFDGDGIDDLAVAAINANNPVDGVSGTGAVYLFNGTMLRTTGTIDLGTTDPTTRIYGKVSQERLGSALAMAHVTSAGAADLIIGAPGAAGVGGTTQAGAIYLLFGGGAAPPLVVAGDPATGDQDATILGPAAGAQIGLAVAAGDLDGDDRADIAVGNYLDGGGRGGVHVVGGTRIQLHAAVDLATQFDARVTGTPGSQLGWSVAIADLDGNGVRELIVGARQAAVVYVFDPTLDGSTLDVGQSQFDVAITGPAATLFGAALATGNLDGDGAADLIVGAPGADGPDGTRQDAGACHVVVGSQLGAITAGEHRTVSLASEAAALTIYGAARNDALCERAVLGNVDLSDALDEIVVGSELGGGNARGTIYVIRNLPSP